MNRDFKILIAEDEEELRELYKLKLESEFVNIIFSVDGEDTLLKVSTEKPDLILLDIMMPKKTGIEVLRELKSKPETSDIPVVILTSLPHEAIREEASELGVRNFLVKSEVTPSQVLRVTNEELGKL